MKRLLVLLVLAFVACTTQTATDAEAGSMMAFPKTCTRSACETVWSNGATMKVTPTAVLACAISLGCGATPINPTPGAGGSTSAGGASSVGGAASGGVSAATGGSVAAGGTTVAPIKWLACNAASKAAPQVKRSLSGWHKDPTRAKRTRLKASYRITSASSFNRPNIATPLDQGDLGSCVGNAVAQCLSTQPFDGKLTEADAVKIYSMATTLDQFAGVYPPTDSGSDGTSGARAAKKLGYTDKSFAAVDTIEGLQIALLSGPCILGTPWYTGFFSPTACGELQLTGSNEGGHEVEIVGWDKDRKIFIMRNSWGPSWGNCRDGNPDECGYAYWSAGTLQTLLNRGAEIDCPVL